MTEPHYDTGFYPWTQEQARALRAKDWAALDVDNLAEESESLGRSERSAIESQLERLLLHLLKWRYDPATRPRRGGQLTIQHTRREIVKRATGTLRTYPAEYLTTAYRHAREEAATATGQPLSTFPEVCEWDAENVQRLNFLPRAVGEDAP